MNNYYDVIKKRLNILKSIKNLNILKLLINNKKKLEKIFKINKFDFINFAAQQELIFINHPRKYIDTNIVGFYNVIENSRSIRLKDCYASSSSVYGETKISS